jgi:hypothetical protein
MATATDKRPTPRYTTLEEVIPPGQDPHLAAVTRAAADEHARGAKVPA